MQTMQVPKRLFDYLSEKNVPYETIQHPERFTAQELAEVEHVKGRFHAKAVIVKCGGDMVMAVLPTDRQLDLEKFEEITGKEAVLATETEFATMFPDCETGTMPPFGELYDMPTYMDESLTSDDYIVFEAGTHKGAVKMSFKDYERLAHPKRGDFTLKHCR